MVGRGVLMQLLQSDLERAVIDAARALLEVPMSTEFTVEGLEFCKRYNALLAAADKLDTYLEDGS